RLGRTEFDRAFAFSPDGLKAAVHLRPGEADLWNLRERKLMATLKHERYLMDVVFSPNNKYVATASADRSARIWSAIDGKPLSPPLLHGWRVTRVLFSPDSRMLASGGVDSTARVWSVPDGKPIGAPLEHRSDVDN